MRLCDGCKNELFDKGISMAREGNGFHPECFVKSLNEQIEKGEHPEMFDVSMPLDEIKALVNAPEFLKVFEDIAIFEPGQEGKGIFEDVHKFPLDKETD